MGTESDNTRDDALSRFFSCGSMNKLEGFGESNLAFLGVGWENDYSIFIFPWMVLGSSSMFLFTKGCFNLRSESAAIFIK